jgi:hypothetical protein
MCEPATLAAITLGVSAASTVYSVDQTKKNARRQERASRDAQKIEEEQLLAQKSVEANERARRGREESARARAASAASGVSGLTLDDLLMDIDFQTGVDMSNINTNTFNSVRASRAGLQSRLNSIQQPDYVAAGLQIAGAGVQYGQTMNEINPDWWRRSKPTDGKGP